MISPFLTVPLSRGHVTLTDWPAPVIEGRMRDIQLLSEVFNSESRDAWDSFGARDITPEVWAAFWRLANASLAPGETWPGRLSWLDRHTVLEAMWELNDLEAAEGKRTALTARSTRRASRIAESLRRQGLRP